MATLNIEGKSVAIDDAFLSLSPDEQNRTVQEIAGQIGIQPQAEGSGLAMNATAGINEGLYGTLGAPVDLARGAMNLGIRGVNAATGADIGQIPSDSFMGSQWIGESLGGLSPAIDPANTVADTTGEKVARGVGQGVGYTVAPQAAAGALMRGGQLSGQAAQTAGQILGRTESTGAVAGNAAIGGLSGGGASAAMEAAPEQWKPLAGLAGGLAAGTAGVAAAGVPGLTRQGARAARDYAAPMTAKGRERMAGEMLRSGTADPQAARQAIDAGNLDILPGSKPTTFQATGDMGLGAMERTAATRRPDLFQQRRADQNAVRVGAMEGIERGGAPEKVAAVVRSRLQQIDRATQDILDRATGAARGSADDLGRGMTPEDAGTSLRGSLEAARAQAKEAERALWNAVDPDGSLVAPADKLRTQASQLLETMPSTERRPSGEEAAIFETIGGLNQVAPFADIAALRSRLSDALKVERRTNGETRTYRRLSMLRGALEDDLSAAISTKVAQEADAVARGAMSADETMLARFEAKRENWFAERQAQARDQGGGVGSVGYGAGGQIAVPGVSGARGQTGRQSSGPSSNPRLSGDGLPSNFDEAARERLTAATTATRERAGTFDNRQLSPLRRRPAKNAPYDMTASAVPGRVFSPGPKGFENVQAYRKAVGDQGAMDALEGYAVDRISKAAMREDGTLDPGRLASWRKMHADALRAFPDLDRRIANAGAASETVARIAAQRKAALDAAQEGILGRLLRLDDPADVKRTVGAVFSAQDGVKRMRTIRQAIGDNKEAKQGLRKAVADYMAERFVGNTEAGTSGVGTMKSDTFQNFVRQNSFALSEAGFSGEEIKLMQRVAEDLQRATRSIAAVRIPGQSNTAQDIMAASKGKITQTILDRMIAAVSGAGGFMVGNVGGGLSAYVGAETMMALRHAGLETIDDIVADALLNPARARVLLTEPAKQAERGTLKMLARLYRQAAVSTAAVSSDQNGRDKPLQIDVPWGGPRH
ncbi:hypothetical protein [Aurantimonas sp. A3-2-R12]|uniref:hypothetical protein n=1 Tax=Aurantimonas sp. A3-2-R12 TaxID=3114362 RepID=UPI002E180DD0|nr:hypothetical protein [Aurantimonas sp. A3-2-R12]